LNRTEKDKTAYSETVFHLKSNKVIKVLNDFNDLIKTNNNDRK